MLKTSNPNNKGIVLLIVLATLLVVTILGNIILNTVLSQSRLTHHQISRIRAYYATQAGMNYAIEMLRLGNWTPDPNPNGITKHYCINGNVDAAIACLDTINDSDIPYHVQIAIGPVNSGINNTAKLEVKTDYTQNS